MDVLAVHGKGFKFSTWGSGGSSRSGWLTGTSSETLGPSGKTSLPISLTKDTLSVKSYGVYWRRGLTRTGLAKYFGMASFGTNCSDHKGCPRTEVFSEFLHDLGKIDNGERRSIAKLMVQFYESSITPNPNSVLNTTEDDFNEILLQTKESHLLLGHEHIPSPYKVRVVWCELTDCGSHILMMMYSL